jgi:D-sedoheptulose 7-phosphate isomerase
MKSIIKSHIYEHTNLIKSNIEEISYCVEKIAKDIKKTLKNKKTIFFIGNGGSAADCEHLAGELVGRYKKNRQPYKAISLTTDTSVITCIANDFGYHKIFERQLKGIGQKGDLLIAFTTSGNSKNIVNALKMAKKLKIKSICLSGKKGGACKKLGNYSYIVPSNSTANIQEVHHLIGHIFCSLVD